MGGSGYPPDILAREGVETMLCSGLGRRAIGLFEQLGIMVYIGAKGTVKDTLDLWKQGGLQQATDETACKKHAFHDSHKDKHENCNRKW
jgi:predicted Fe-Mo cluster-binding NifX family protein